MNYQTMAEKHNITHIIGDMPCELCLVRATCVNVNYDGLQTNTVECEGFDEYKLKFWTAIKETHQGV